MIEEQPNPIRGVQDIHLLAIEHFLETAIRQNEKGFNKYGSFLMTFNGRDTVRDIREEMADANNYLEVLIQEYNVMRKILFELYSDIDAAKSYIEEHYHEDIVEFIKKYN